MPCQKGMIGCKPGCRHRRMVEEYRLARYAQEQARDLITHQCESEEELWRENGGRLLTFKDWLVGYADSVAEEDDMPSRDQASEYGGVSGLVQPPPHELTPAEQARLDRWQDSTTNTYDPLLDGPQVDGVAE